MIWIDRLYELIILQGYTTSTMHFPIYFIHVFCTGITNIIVIFKLISFETSCLICVLHFTIISINWNYYYKKIIKFSFPLWPLILSPCFSWPYIFKNQYNCVCVCWDKIIFLVKLEEYRYAFKSVLFYIS